MSLFFGLSFFFGLSSSAGDKLFQDYLRAILDGGNSDAEEVHGVGVEEDQSILRNTRASTGADTSTINDFESDIYLVDSTHGVGVAEDHFRLWNSGVSTSAYDTLTVNDVSPIELVNGVRVQEDHSSLRNSGASTAAYDTLTIEDVSPIDSATRRFVKIIVDHFICHHVIETDYMSQSGEDKLTRDIQYQGDPSFVLPSMYIANIYESLVKDVNQRLDGLNGTHKNNIYRGLEASGGLYRELAKKVRQKGSCEYRTRELTMSLDIRTRFPELVIPAEDKRVRLVVCDGLEIVEKPSNIPIEDAEWFKRLTGRNEVAISAQDYKFYSPRHKNRGGTSNSVSNIPGLPAFPGSDNTSTMATAQGCSISELQTQQQIPSEHHMESLPHQPQFHHIHQNHCQHIHQCQHPAHFSQNHQCGPPSNLSEITHAHQSPAITQHMACSQPLTGGHAGERLHVMPTSPAKFCDGCGARHLRESSMFCSKCGVKRLGI